MDYARTTGMKAPLLGNARTLTQYESGFAALNGLLHWWDANPSRVTIAANISIANRVAGGPALVEQTGASGAVLDSSALLPLGGFLSQVVSVNANTVLAHTGFPDDANSVWTKIILAQSRRATMFEGNSFRNLWGGPSGNVANHWLRQNVGFMRAMTGSTAGGATANSASPMYTEDWFWAICSWNQTSLTLKLSVNGQTVSNNVGTVPIASDGSKDTAYLFEQGASPGSWIGEWGMAAMLAGTSGAPSQGDLFLRTTDLAFVNEYMAALCGRLRVS